MVSQKNDQGAKVAFTKGFLFAVAVFLFGVIVVRLFTPAVTSGYAPDITKGICIKTKGKLGMIRAALKYYYESEHTYPDSLADLQTYMRTELDMGCRADLKEYMTEKDGNDHESTVLDGTGGWYYDKTTGKVKLNITRPVMHYLGPTLYAEETPADW